MKHQIAITNSFTILHMVYHLLLLLTVILYLHNVTTSLSVAVSWDRLVYVLVRINALEHHCTGLQLSKYILS